MLLFVNDDGGFTGVVADLLSNYAKGFLTDVTYEREIARGYMFSDAVLLEVFYTCVDRVSPSCALYYFSTQLFLVLQFQHLDSEVSSMPQWRQYSFYLFLVTIVLDASILIWQFPTLFLSKYDNWILEVFILFKDPGLDILFILISKNWIANFLLF